MNIAAYPTYERYSDSGVPWLGDIPEHWSVKRAGFLLDELNARSKDGTEPLLSLSKTLGVVRRDSMAERGGHAETLVGYKHVAEGNIVINRMQAANGLLAVSEINGITSPDYAIYRVKEDSNIRSDIAALLLQQPEYQGEIKRRVKGVMEGFIRLYSDDLFRLPMICAPLPEQRAIAGFLDRKCASIDEAVRIKEEQIKLLRERRQILIQQAVTRGLNPSAPMKDSGIDWIGQIPAHWEVKRLASFGRFSKGGGFSKSDLAETGVDAVLYGDIYTKYSCVIDEPIRKISATIASDAIRLVEGDLLFTGSGETREDIGKCVLFRSTREAVCGGDVIMFRQTENDPLFLSFCLNTDGVVEQKAKSSKGEIIVHTYGSKLRNIFIPIPPRSEQKEIAKFISDSIERIEAAIALKNTQIKALKEYKTSLINAAVTGKIKVI